MRASRGEITIEEILTENGINFKMEYSFEDLKAPNGTLLRFDFAVFDDDWNLLFLIEFQGRQHYEAVSKFRGAKGLYQQQYNDNLKRRYCGLHGIKLVEIPYKDEYLLSYDYIMEKAGCF
jgi:hypothetical protein